MATEGDAPWVVTGLGMWLPGVPSRQAWRDGARPVDTTAADPPTGALLDKRTRRRASGLCRALADAFADAAAQSGLPIATTASVFGSALGEVTTMLGVLEQMTRGEELSPMHFATSVHNTASGMISISNANRAFTTSISADYDTVAAALFEASGVIETSGVPVVVVCGDERSPERFVDHAHAYDLMAAALVVQSEPAEAPVLARLGVPRARRDDDVLLAVAPVPPTLVRHPQIGLLDLAAAILRQEHGVVALDRGGGRGWVVPVDARPR